MTQIAWIRRLFDRRVAADTRPSRRRRALQLEPLEDRLVPASFTVTDVTDNANDLGSIRFAVNNLSAGANTINFSPSVDGKFIVLSNGELSINHDVTITGPGANELIISGSVKSRVLEIKAGATVQVSGLTLGFGSVVEKNGGAVFNSGNLTLLQCTITGSTTSALAPNYDVNTDLPVFPQGGWGGGLYNAPHATVTIEQSTISNNTAQGGAGATGYGGLGGGAGGGAAGMGGGVFNSLNATMTLIDSTISGNSATGGDGGKAYSSLIMYNGPGGAGGGHYGGRGAYGKKAYSVLSDLTGYDGGFGSGGGGGYGQGVWNRNGGGGNGGFGGGGGGGGSYSGSGLLGSSIQTGGTSIAYGGTGGNGGSTGRPGHAGSGYTGGGGGGAGLGGGVFSDGTLTITSSTIANNTAKGGNGGGNGATAGAGVGGGVFACNVVNYVPNSSPTIGSLNPSATIDSSIVYNNVVGGPGPAFNWDVNGAFTDLGYNLVGDTSGATGLDASTDVQNGAILLSPLANNGGTTLTMAITATGEAAGAGDPANGNAVDQRGRPRGATPDIGAFQATKAIPVLTWNTPQAINFGTPLSAAQLDATASVPGTLTYSKAIGDVLKAGSYRIQVTFTPDDTTDYASATAEVQLVVNQAAPNITWNPVTTLTHGQPLTAAQLHATANVPGGFTYSYLGGNVHVGSILPIGQYYVDATFTPVDQRDYHIEDDPVLFTVNRAVPTITWAAPAAITYGTPLSAAQLDATASVPGTFTYTPASGTVLNAGTQTLSVTFTPTDATDYATTTTTVPLTITKVTPNLSWATPAPIGYGTPLSLIQLDAVANVAGLYRYTPGRGAILNAGAHTLTVSFTPFDSTDYTAASASVSLLVGWATPALSWSDPAPITYGTPLSDTQLNATANIPGTFTYTPALGTVMHAGFFQTLSVVFTPTDSADYLPAIGSVKLSVGQAVPAITWSAPAPIAYGTPLSTSQLDANADVDGSFNYIPDAGTVLGAGSQTLTAVFAPTDSIDYAPVAVSTPLIVTPAMPTLSWAPPAAITYGTPLSATQLDATANVPGTLTYTPAPDSILLAAPDLLTVVFTPDDTTDYLSAQAEMTLNVNRATPTIQVSDAGGTFTGSAFPATASVTGIGGLPDNSLEGITPTLTYYTGNQASGTPLAGAPTAAGVYTVTAAFPGSVDYAAASAATTFTIDPAPTMTALSVSGTTFNVGQAVTFTAAVSDTLGTPPAGMVQFLIDGQNFGAPVTLDAGGLASYTTTGLSAGSHTITAQYTGNGNFAASVSQELNVSVVGGNTNDQVQLTPTGGSTGVQTEALDWFWANYTANFMNHNDADILN